MSEGFKKIVPKKPLSEAEIEAKTAEFASKADVQPLSTPAQTAIKNPERSIRFTVRMNEDELLQLEKICAATGFNKVVAVRQALRDYALKVISV